jgi:hypothetical protein
MQRWGQYIRKKTVTKLRANAIKKTRKIVDREKKKKQAVFKSLRYYLQKT